MSSVLLSIAVTGAACGARTELGEPCPSAPIDPVAFPPVTFAGQATLLGWALDVTDDAAYFAAGGGLNASGQVYRTLARAPLGGGEPEPFATDATYAEGMLAHDASYLYFPNAGVGNPSGVWVQNVVAAPLHGGPSRTLDNPPAPSQGRWVGSIGTNGDAGVFWIVTGPGFSDGLLAHWDGTTTTTLASFPSGPSTTPELTLGMAVSATQAFVLTSHALYSVPLSGGTPVELRAWPPVSPMSYAQPQIVALNDQSVFYSLDAATIVRRDIGSGDEHTIVGGLTLESLLYGSRYHPAVLDISSTALCDHRRGDGTARFEVSRPAGYLSFSSVAHLAMSVCFTESMSRAIIRGRLDLLPTCCSQSFTKSSSLASVPGVTRIVIRSEAGFFSGGRPGPRRRVGTGLLNGCQEFRAKFVAAPGW